MSFETWFDQFCDLTMTFIRIQINIILQLPLLEGDMFGKYIYERVPPLKFLDDLETW